MIHLRAAGGVRIFLLIVAAALVCGLIVCPKPWTDGVAVAEAAGVKLDHEQFVASYFWPMAAVNLVLCVILFVAAPVLVRPIAEKKGEIARTVLSRAQKILLILCLLISTLSTLYHTVPRMTKSLWVDEERTARRLVFGNTVRVNDKGRSTHFGESVALKPIPWSATLWRYRTPNNHPFYSVSARFAHETASKISEPHPLHFREWVLRLPALAAGIGALFAVPWLLLNLGFVRAAMIAPLLLSVHAYFLRFSSDARGYSMTFLLAPLCAVFLWKGMRTGRWRWWAGFALAQFLVAWSHGSSVYFLVVLNAWGFAAPWLWKGGLAKAEKLAINGRHFLMSCFSGMAFLQMFLPNLAQTVARDDGNDGSMPDDIGLGKVQDMLSLYFTGERWRPLHNGEHPHSYTLMDRFGDAPFLLWAFLALLAVIFVIGLIRVWKRGGAAGWFFAVLLLPGPLMYGISYLKHFFMFEQYIVMIVPWIAMTIAIGLAGVSGLFRKVPVAGAALVCLFVGLAWWVCEPQRTAFRSHPIEQNKDGVLKVRGSLDPEAEGYHDVITAGFVRYTRTYDPHLYPIKGIKDVDRLLTMSRESGKPLWFYMGVITFSEQIGKHVVDHIRANSEHVEHLWGLDGMSAIDLFRFTPGPTPEKNTSVD